MINTNDKKNNTCINIDTPDFFNPFEYSEISISNQEKMKLYSNYFSLSTNQKILKNIGNNELVSDESESTGWTRSEVLRSLACYYGYRQKLTIVHRDILKNNYGIIVHQVNCQGVMGSGLAKSIKEKWPIVFEQYKKMRVMNPGMVQLVRIPDSSNEYPLYVCNLFGQDNYGPAGKRYTQYFGVKRGLAKLKKMRRSIGNDLPIYFPYQMGCVRGGGDWDKYSSYIMKYFPDAVICRL